MYEEKNKFVQSYKINIELIFCSALYHKIIAYNVGSDMDLMLICMNYVVITKKSFKTEK